MINFESVIIRPLLTEKSTTNSEKNNSYSFQVHLKSNKHQIKTAVEKFFDVKVTKIRTVITPGKAKKTGRAMKKTSAVKKAYVQVTSGQKIEFFKGI